MGRSQRAEITMSDDEVDAFIAGTRTATLGTIGPTGAPHLVAMWFAYLDGRVYFETKAKSQKAVNLRRDPRLTCLFEAGETYDQLRGVSLEGRAHFIEDPDDEEFWAVGVDVFERYNGPYTEEMRPFVEQMLHNRVVVRVEPARARSWDHRKLGLPEIPLGGTTAPDATS